MTHPLLESAYAKLGRARKHLLDLNTEVAEYVVAEPKGLATKFEPQVPEQQGAPGVTVRVEIETEPPPSISLIAGDAIQNIRSALDHLAEAVVRRNRGHPDHKTQFSIFTDRLGTKGGIRAVHFHPRASVLANTILEALQPYHRTNDPTEHPLAVLQELSNIDKHRRFHVVSGYAGDISVRFQTSVFTAWVKGEGLMENGALLFYSGGSADPTSINNVDVTMAHSIQVGLKEFRKGGAAPLDTLLDDLLEFTREKVIDRFCRRIFRSQPPPSNLLGL